MASVLQKAFGNRTGAGFLGGGLLAVAATPRADLLLAGAGVALLGALVRVWASGHLKKNEALARSGPYSVVRHPLYLGSGLLWTGLLLGGGNPWFAAPAALVFVGYHARAVRREERDLEAAFGEEFRGWRTTVPAVLSGPRSLARLPRALAQGGFSPGLAWKHREWHVPLAAGALLAALAAFDGRGEPASWRIVAAVGLAVAALGRVALFALLDREVTNPAARLFVSLLSRKKRRERSRRGSPEPGRGAGSA